jgi:hypothetical protein
MLSLLEREERVLQDQQELGSIIEMVYLTKMQNEVLNVVSDKYEDSI